MLRYLFKKRSKRELKQAIDGETREFQWIRRFSTARDKLPPKSVGASVDKVFAILYRPRITWLIGFWSKNDQQDIETVVLDKSRIFLGLREEIFEDVHSCPQLLWVELWITCLRKAGRCGGHSSERNRSYFVQF